jgi:hypothetical protein
MRVHSTAHELQLLTWFAFLWHICPRMVTPTFPAIKTSEPAVPVRDLGRWRGGWHASARPPLSPRLMASRPFPSGRSRHHPTPGVLLGMESDPANRQEESQRTGAEPGFTLSFRRQDHPRRGSSSV